MALSTDAQVLADLAKNQVSSVYVLVGDDEVGKGPVIDALCALVEPDLQGFNLERIYANERPVGDIVASARTLPLLGTRRVIVALRCESFLKPKKKASASDAEDDGEGAQNEPDTASGATAELERYLSAASPETVLVLVAADWARNTRIAKQLIKTAVVVEYWGLKGDRDVKGNELTSVLRAGVQYVLTHLRESGFRIRSDAVEAVVQHAGTDLAVLRNDLDRLMTYSAGRAEITIDDVRAVVGGAVQVDEWALTRAIQAGDAREALRQLQLGLEAGQSPWMLLGQLGWFVRSRLVPQVPARAGTAVDALLRADMALKSSGDPQVLLERLVVELCGGGERRGVGRPWQRA